MASTNIENKAELKKRIEASNLYVCELYVKPDCILTSKFELIFALDIQMLHGTMTT
jgi:methionine synthase II (cobalamin-independent)